MKKLILLLLTTISIVAMSDESSLSNSVSNDEKPMAYEPEYKSDACLGCKFLCECGRDICLGSCAAPIYLAYLFGAYCYAKLTCRDLTFD